MKNIGQLKLETYDGNKWVGMASEVDLVHEALKSILCILLAQVGPTSAKDVMISVGCL